MVMTPFVCATFCFILLFHFFRQHFYSFYFIFFFGFSFSSFSFLRMKQSSFAHLFVVFAVGYTILPPLFFSRASCVHSIIPVMNVVRFNHRKCSLLFPAFHTKVFKYLRARDNSSIKIQVRPVQSAAFSIRYVLFMREGRRTTSTRAQHSRTEAAAAAPELYKKKLFRKLAFRKMWMPSGTRCVFETENETSIELNFSS